MLNYAVETKTDKELISIQAVTFRVEPKEGSGPTAFVFYNSDNAAVAAFPATEVLSIREMTDGVIRDINAKGKADKSAQLRSLTDLNRG